MTSPLGENILASIAVAIRDAEVNACEHHRTVANLLDVLQTVIDNNNDLARRYREQNRDLSRALAERDELRDVLNGRTEALA